MLAPLAPGRLGRIPLRIPGSSFAGRPSAVCSTAIPLAERCPGITAPTPLRIPAPQRDILRPSRPPQAVALSCAPTRARNTPPGQGGSLAALTSCPHQLRYPFALSSEGLEHLDPTNSPPQQGGYDFDSGLTRLTQRDREILRALTRAVRVASLDQIAQVWWHGADHATTNARARLRRLVDRGLLQSRRVNYLEREATEPLCTWSPGEAPPNFDALSYRLERRAEAAAGRLSTVYQATSKAARATAGKPPLYRHNLQLAHDLVTTSVYMRYLEKWPELSPQWRGEDFLGGTARRADAVLLDPAGRPHRLIEVGGVYSPAKIASSHALAARRSLSWELW